MKSIYALLLAAFTVVTTSCGLAAGGPDAYGYTWTTSLDAGGPAYNWIDITSRTGVQTVTGLADDNSSASMINVGFNFHYYWNDYSQVKVGSNGWLSFNNVSNIASCFPSIPTPGGAGDNLLAPLMSDLNFTGTGNPGQVKYWTNNTDSCIISYINVPFWSVSAPGWAGSNSFQVILCAADSSITFQYGSLGGGFVNNAACIDLVTGIENSSGTVGLQVHNDALPPSNYAIRFDYPSVVLMSIQDPTASWNTNNGSKAVFLPFGVAYTLQANYRNAGNTDVTTPIDLSAAILDMTSATVHSDAGSLPSLATGDDTTYTYANAWTPPATGQYTFQSQLTNAQDINTANNTNNSELDVVDICSPTLQLSYVTGNVPSGSVNWNGGANDDGAAVYYAPPVYPYTVSTLQFYISSNVSDGYITSVYDDDGPNGTPGTLLFTQTVPSASVIAGSWNTVTIPAPVTLNDGGFYVAWLQGGTTIFLGTEMMAPFSHRNYEILDGAWADYRETASRDLCIRASITGFDASPVAAFSNTTDHLDAGFTDLSTGQYISHAWDFGDGNTSTSQNPSHTYAAAGTYNTCLVVTNVCGEDDTICQAITVCDDATAVSSAVSDHLSADFTDASTGTVTGWAWDFGDGSTSTSQNPSHTYPASGTYTYCLIASNDCGYNDTICQAITVCNDATAAASAVSDHLSADFTDASTGTVTGWAWDFGDGSTSTSQNPSHTYPASGTYTYCLIASNDCGYNDTICQAITICDDATAASSAVSDHLSAVFTDASTGTVTGWVWDFGDGNTSTTQNSSHTYAASGTYTYCLIASNDCGYNDTICQTITVCDDATAASSAASNNLSADFTDASTGTVTGWAWDFGDGNTSNSQNPSHTYAAPGTYTYCLIASNDCGYGDTICQAITICDTLTVDYNWSANDLAADFTDLSTGSTWAWDFGDGNTSTDQNPSHTYTAAGTYNVCLAVTNACGEDDTICQTITVCSSPTANWSVDTDGLSMEFFDQSTGSAATWQWDFGDGNTSTVQDPAHTYPADGTYNVCLIVSNSCGEADTFCLDVNACSEPTALFNTSASGLTIGFTDQSTGNAVSWAWDFGDASISTLQNPSHTYAAEGTYTVCLSVTKSCGSVDSICHEVVIDLSGIAENAPLILNGYPNPTDGLFYIDFATELLDAQLEITDLAGKVIRTERVSGKSVQADVSQLSAGFYKVRIVHASGTGVLTFVKQ